jgi:putative tricarboxylic transport membrane protein
MVRWGFPLAPMVFAMILGPLADQNLRRAVLVFQGEPLTAVLMRPVGVVILLVIVATIVYGLRREAKPVVSSAS